jgi:hypothetical protein
MEGIYPFDTNIRAASFLRLWLAFSVSSMEFVTITGIG